MGFAPHNIKIFYADIATRTPAQASRKRGEIYLNVNRWHSIEPAHRVFIILHEMAHIVLDTSNEFLVDEWAQKQYIKMGYPLTESVKALTQVLAGSNTEQINRAKAQLQRAKAIDNQNKMHITKTFNQLPFYEAFNHAQNDDFLGMGKAAKARKTDRLQLKRDVKLGKINVSQTLANQGIVNKSSGAGKKAGAIAGALVGVAGGALGAGGAGFEAGNAISKAFGGADDAEATEATGNTEPGANARISNPNYAVGNNKDGSKKKWYQTNGGMAAIVATTLSIIIGTMAYLHLKK